MKMKLNYVWIAAVLFAIGCSAPQKKEEASTAEDVPFGDITYSADTINMKGYFAFDEGSTEKRPGILVVHEWWGHNEYARERADMLADLGYVAFALDMYGDGKVAEHPEDAGKFAGEVSGNIDKSKAMFESALEQLENHPYVDSEKIGAIGYCMGGTVALSMASAGYDLDAVAAFHAGLGLPIMPDSGMVKGKILVANGADDPFIPAQQIEDFKATMDAAGVDYTYIAYPGAVHSFTSKYADEMGQKFELPLAYNAAADSASWAEMQALFNSVF